MEKDEPLLKFSPDYKSWKEKFDNEPLYTRRQMSEALQKQAIELQVSRVVQSFNGKYGPDCSAAMQILAIHQTPGGVLVIVR